MVLLFQYEVTTSDSCGNIISMLFWQTIHIHNSEYQTELCNYKASGVTWWLADIKKKVFDTLVSVCELWVEIS